MPNRYGVRAHMVGATRSPARPAFVRTLVSNLCVSRRFGYLRPNFFHDELALHLDKESKARLLLIEMIVLHYTTACV